MRRGMSFVLFPMLILIAAGAAAPAWAAEPPKIDSRLSYWLDTATDSCTVAAIVP